MLRMRLASLGRLSRWALTLTGGVAGEVVSTVGESGRSAAGGGGRRAFGSGGGSLPRRVAAAEAVQEGLRRPIGAALRFVLALAALLRRQGCRVRIEVGIELIKCRGLRALLIFTAVFVLRLVASHGNSAGSCGISP
jgi:hypothetical protein